MCVQCVEFKMGSILGRFTPVYINNNNNNKNNNSEVSLGANIHRPDAPLATSVITNCTGDICTKVKKRYNAIQM